MIRLSYAIFPDADHDGFLSSMDEPVFVKLVSKIPIELPAQMSVVPIPIAKATLVPSGDQVGSVAKFDIDDVGNVMRFPPSASAVSTKRSWNIEVTCRVYAIRPLTRLCSAGVSNFSVCADALKK